MRVALVAVALLAGCLHPAYTCETDADCNVGAAGRCEANHECTVYDPTCSLERRYTEYSGSDSNVCFDDSAVPLNECAGGQPPVPMTKDACAQTVCGTYMPSCCISGWSDACVQEAQVHCGLKCNFDVALVVESGPNLLTPGQNVELWDVRFTEGSATTRVRADLPGPSQRVGFLAWLAPAPGQSSPRLASLDGSGNLMVEGSATRTFALDPTLTYDGVASVDFDRDGVDTAVLSGNSTGSSNVTVLKLDNSGAYRSLDNSLVMPLQTWGDANGDAFPDAAAANGDAAQYRFIYNHDESNGERGVDDLTETGMQGGITPPVRSFEWTEINGDTNLDLVAFGDAIQITFGMAPGLGLMNVANIKIDCDPPTTTLSKCSGSAANTIGFAGAVELEGAETTILASVIDTTGTGEPSRVNNLYRLHFTGQPPQVNLNRIDTFTLTAMAGSACTGECSIEAVVARDFDGDGIIDVLAIDSSLGVWLGLSSATTPAAPPMNLVLTYKLPYDTTVLTAPIPILRTSVSGTVQ